jgi:hypothetical protein
MKQKDLAIIAVVVIVSMVFSYVIANKVIVKSKNREQKVEIVGNVPSSISTPSSTIFNSNAIDPSQPIQIQSNSNSSPFGTTQSSP